MISKPDETLSNDNDYIPHDNEPFMSAKQKNYFKKLLLDWKSNLATQSQRTLQDMRNSNIADGDECDHASHEYNTSNELRRRDRERKLLAKIDRALLRISNDTYGYCRVSGKPIPIKRLLARPVAELSIDVQKEIEEKEKIGLVSR